MSAFSTKIYGNDMALDVINDFNNLFCINKSLEVIHQYICSYQPEDNDEEACAFWSALACIEWEYGILDGKIKAKAVDIINNYSDAYLYFSEEDKEKRQTVLNALLLRLDTINTTPKKKKSIFIYHCPWKVGDVLALPLNNQYAYIHVYGVQRRKEKIEELAEDSLYIKVFDKLSDEILDVKQFKSTLFSKQRYLKLDYYEGENCELRTLWCVSKREKEEFEKRVTYIGNIPVKTQYSNGVCKYYQFKLLTDSLTKRFNNKYLSDT